MQGKRVARVETQDARESKVEFKILGVGNVEDFRLSLLIFLKLRHGVSQRKQVSCRLYLGLDGYVVVAIITHAEARPHDEQVFIVIAQYGVAVRNIVEIVCLEALANPWHVHIAKVWYLEFVVQMASDIAPVVFPGCRKDTAVELRAVLEVPANRQFGRCVAATTELSRGKGREKAWELQSSLHAILLVVVVGIALQALDSLESGTQFDAEQLAAMEQIAVLIGENGSCSKVARSVGALGLECNCVGFGGRKFNVGF